MFFLAFARDKQGHLALRMSTKEAHVAHLDKGDPAVRLLQSGPWLGSDGTQAGSLLVFAADSRSDVEAFMARDPYAQAGLFESVEIMPWLWNRGNPYRQDAR
ncbi:YciI family protein [Paracoccus shandongensis]|uniref:YciI family protein n=1 Tax=Paracoccus shandongensis TaxID=2816048 RepID=UPI001A8ECD32|nr:YciI family protein [Paracoccus shandongensis]